MRRSTIVTRSLLASTILLALAGRGRADAFDNYTNPLLNKVMASDAAKEMKRVTPDDLLDNDRVLPGVDGAVLIVKTNQGATPSWWSHPARQKTDMTHSVATLLIDRYVTYKEGEERTVAAAGKNLVLFPGFRVSLDMGQVVPEELGGDLRFVADGDKILRRAGRQGEAVPAPQAVAGGDAEEAGKAGHRREV